VRLKVVFAAALALCLGISGTLAGDQSRPAKPKDVVLHIETHTQIGYTLHVGYGSAFIIRRGERFAVVSAVHVIAQSPERKAIVFGVNYPTRLTLTFSTMDNGDIASADIDKIPDGWQEIGRGVVPPTNGRCGAWGFPHNTAIVQGHVGFVVGELSKAEVIGLRMPAGSRYLRIRGFVTSGMSGGPVVNEDGNVFGVVSYFAKDHSDQYTALLP
jgi:S1-C subfamily serine protease